MSKTETMRESAEQLNAKRIANLSRQIEQARTSKSESVESLAATLEPLAIAMANLSEELKTEIHTQSDSSATAAAAVQTAIENATAAAEKITAASKTGSSNIKKATEEAQEAAQSIQGASLSLIIKTAAIAALTSSLLTVALSIWLLPQPVLNKDPAIVAIWQKLLTIEEQTARPAPTNKRR